MRVLIASVTYYPDVNGASYFTHRLAYYLKKKGHEVMVIAPSRTMRHGVTYHNDVPAFGVRSYPVLMYEGFRVAPPLFTKRAIKKVIRDFNPDVIHMQSHFLICKQVVGLAKEMNIPIVGTNHFMPENLVHYLPAPRYIKEVAKNIGWKQFKKTYEKLDLVTTPTQTAADLTKKSGLSQAILPLSNGIDMERFRPENDGEHLGGKYSLPQKPILLYVGRLDKEKNVDKVLQALTLVPQNVDFHFAVAGKGAEKEHLEKLSEKLGLTEKVTFLGFVPDEDLPGLYSLSSCFIIAGIAELQCLVAMEAMASGLPVIGVRAVALPELIHHGENGFLFELDDKKGLAKYIEEMFSNDALRQQMSRKSLEIVEKHDIRKIIGQFESIYALAIKNNEKNN
jgi:glycosyltransferase involved in cell wall biosynthesis